MKHVGIFCLLFSLFCITTLIKAQDGLVSETSSYSVDRPADRLETLLQEKGVTVFEIVDHQQGASSVNMDLRPTVLFIFGNPKLGTPVIHCAQTAALDLPQKMLIWENGNGEVKIGYNNPDYIKRRHKIEGCDAVLNKIAKVLDRFASHAAGN